MAVARFWPADNSLRWADLAGWHAIVSGNTKPPAGLAGGFGVHLEPCSRRLWHHGQPVQATGASGIT